jgi:hypothetical protein
MKSKEEIVRLLWTLAGAIFGLAVGLALNAALQAFVTLPIGAQGLIALLLPGLGLVGGGYLALTLVGKRQKVQRKKYFEEKKKRKKRK